ncbi:MAG TPA: Uma2 family endonuclease [Acidobacteriota bacterium]|nr:Uma2 family endonuclease [Acidobacteriota bacterium]
MAASVTTTPGDYVPTADQRVVSYGVSWSQYESQLELRGERSVPRISYLEGALELMTPSKDHERLKSYIGRLVEAYALEKGIDLSPYGSWTLEQAPKQAGLEPDECYLIGDQDRDTPDLAIEVHWTSGGIDKLEIYRRLAVREVWVWKDSLIEVQVLQVGRYQRREKSMVFPELNLAFVCSLLDRPTALQAVKALRQSLR